MEQIGEVAAVPTVGVDLGDRHSRVCVLDEHGEIVEEGRIPTTSSGVEHEFGPLGRPRVVIAMETHANWMHDPLADRGHEVVVANVRKVRAISANERKCDELDARMLAQLGRTDARLLKPVQVRLDLSLVRARAT